MSTQQQPGWWRRNALALALAAALLAATVGITSWKEWTDYFGLRPTQPIAVDVAAPAEFAGATWQLVDLLAGTSDDVASIPEGTTMLLARVQITPGAETLADGTAPGCRIWLASQGGAHGDREWNTAAQRPIGYTTSAGYEASCVPGATAPYTLEVPFIVPTEPAGDTGALSLVIEVPEQLPKHLRLALPAG